MRFLTRGALAVLLVAAQVAAAPNPKLAKAKALFDDLEVEQAAKVLDDAAAQGGYDTAGYVELLGLKGLVEATLGHGRQARDAFYQLLVLDPDWKLPGDQPPRVRTPFYEAKGLAAENGRTELEPEATIEAGTVTSVAVTVKRDPLKAGKAVVFHLDVGGTERVARADLDANGRAEAKVGAAGVKWWAELFSAKDDVLVVLNSAASPREDGASAAPVAAVTPEPPTVTKPAGPNAWMRPTAYGLVGAGVVAAGAGAWLGTQAEAARARIRDAETNSAGVVTGLTQKEAYALDASARSDALVANILFGSAAALAGSGVVLFVLGGDSGEAVSFAPTPAGVVVSGTF